VLPADTYPQRGLTVADVAKRYRVSPDKVRGWIIRGELGAINTSSVRCGRPRYVVMPEALARFERGRSAAAPPKPPRRKKIPSNWVDYFPND
jgi:transposase